MLTGHRALEVRREIAALSFMILLMLLIMIEGEMGQIWKKKTPNVQFRRKR